MKTTMVKKSIFAALGLATLSLGSCFEGYQDDLIDHVNTQASIYVLRNNFKGSDIKISEQTLEGATSIGGVVISQHQNNNLPANTIAIQSTWRGQTRGILVEVENSSNYVFGDSLNMNLIGATLTAAEGALRIKNIASANIDKISTGHIKTHNPVAINTIAAQPQLFESTLITITADIAPEPPIGSKLSGEHDLIDGDGNTLSLVTDAQASFSQSPLAPSASFRGILSNINGEVVLRMQELADQAFASGKLYQGWPESFEIPYQGKVNYNHVESENIVQMATGPWWLFQVIQGETAGRDRIVTGKQALRFQQNLSQSGYAQMNFDVPDGASKVTLWYGAYYTDRSSTFSLEYSTDQGQTWKAAGEQISDAHPTSVSLVAKQAIFMVDIKGPVRFRVNKIGLGTTSNTVQNGRMGIDDFAIYKSY